MHGVRSSSATGRRCRSAPFDTHAAAGWPLDDELSRLFDDFEECRAAICACVEVRRELVEALSDGAEVDPFLVVRSEEHTSELQSLMRISYAVFFLKKKTQSNKSKKTSQVCK